MRKLIFAINISLDGCCDHTKAIPYEDVHEYHTRLLQNVDTLVYGRITYQLMVPYWPDVAKNHSAELKSIDDFAQAFDSVANIIVFSKTLEGAEGKKTRIVRTNLQDEIMKLKQQKGGNMITGGVNIPTQLIQAGLIDEYHFVIQPIIVGEGTRLLEGTALPEKLQLNLAETKILKSGCVALRYLKN